LLKAKAVVVYRSSPGQKAEVVRFMKKFSHEKIILAIGDGANDVNMIQQSHIGFGLMGKEGNQAAAFADYAIPCFKDLRRVLFWHGRPYGVRLINLVQFVLYKAMIKSANNYGLQWVNGFSGFQAVEGLMHVLFNILMTVFFNFIVSVYD
jgi:P-type E1-E2 ATPase